MKNRQWKIGNGKPPKGKHAGAAFVPRGTFPISGFLFSIFLGAAVAGRVGVGRHVALAAPPETPPAAAAASTPAPHVPAGFGKAKFGMTSEQARQLYPTLVLAPAVTRAAYFKSPNLTRYWMTKVDVPGLPSQCTIEFRFWKNRLWSVIVYYRSTAFAEVVEHLRRQYGPPTTKSGDPSWVLDNMTITTSQAQMWYSLDDSEIGTDVQRAFMDAIQQQQKRKAAQAPAKATPAGQAPVGRATPAG